MGNDTSVVVLIAGALGSQLSWTDPSDPAAGPQLIWPPGLGDADGYRWNTQLLSNSVQPVDIIMIAGCDMCPDIQTAGRPTGLVGLQNSRWHPGSARL